MNSKIFSEALSEIDSRYVEEAVQYRKERENKNTWIKWAAAAICLMLVFAAGFYVADWKGSQIKLSDNSFHVTARYKEREDSAECVVCLVALTEEELFTRDTAAFKGSISEIRDIQLKFNGRKNYCAVADIEVEKVYRGSCGVGDTVSVMIPYLGSDDTVSAMRVGMTGIFIPEVFDENSVWEENGAKLDRRDLADYGFPDCQRYAFLKTKKRLVFDRGAYESIADAQELSEIEEYVQTMLKKLSVRCGGQEDK